MKYKRPDDDFYKTLRKRVDAYFERTGKSRKGNPEAWLKVALVLGLGWGAYFAMLFADVPGWARIVLAFVVGFAHVGFALQIGHEASHNALFESKRLNWLFARAWNMGGSDATAWHLTHDRIHHNYPNVADTDGDIQRPAPFLRMSPSVPWRPWHRYQRFYAPLLYMQIVVFGVTLRDFKDLRILPNKNAVEGMNAKLPWHAVPIMLTSKVVYFTYVWVIPTWVLGVPFWQVFVVWLLVQWSMGLNFALGLLPAHVSSQAPVLARPEDGVIPSDYARHAFDSVVDYATGNYLFSSYYGGLNMHVIHHLFPDICHVHFRHLLPILRETAREYGVEYRETTLWQAVRWHFEALERNGRPEWEGKKAGVPVVEG